MDVNPIVLVYGHPDASTGLFFGGMSKDLKRHFRFHRPADLAADAKALARANLVVIAREFLPFVRKGLLSLLVRLDIPFFWFSDDDLLSIKHEKKGASLRHAHAFRLLERHAKGYIGTSPNLMARFANFGVERLALSPMPPDSVRTSPPPEDSAEFRVGMFGGDFRKQSLEEHVLPALARISGERRVRLFVHAELNSQKLASDTVVVPFERDLTRFLEHWQALRLDAVVHPYGSSANLPNKNPATLLLAAAIGAVPVVGEEPAFRGFTECDGVLKAERSIESWHEALVRLTRPSEARRMFGLLEACLRSRFNAEANRDSFEQLVAIARASAAHRQAIVHLSDASIERMARRARLRHGLVFLALRLADAALRGKRPNATVNGPG